ncbi:APC family permease [Acinetobacter larvae]|uniref:Amino acid transporter n=1 Tax=Acinetobacter larvae TaxID=1789224 RepID=A0A1B2LXU7_9GAMM|nr:APC family permease [Acinetobacter larvae]AOA57709.1 amino acid transporter [Acinetobacter larvae]
MNQNNINNVQTETTASGHLHGRLNARHLVFMVIAAAAPLTVVGGNVPLSIGLGNGPGALWGFFVSTVVLFIFAIGFVQMTPFVKEAGAFYSYIDQGLGRKMSVGAAYTALISYTAVQVGIYGYIGWAVQDLLTSYGVGQHPWWLYSLVCLLIVGLFGYRNIDFNSRVLGLLMILEIGIVMIMNIGILSQGGAQGIESEPFKLHYILDPGISLSILFALTGFIGFESAAIYREEAINPEKTIARATYLAVIIIGVFYTFSAWCLTVAVGSEQARAVAQQTLSGHANMMIDVAQQYVGTAFKNVMQVLLITSLFACVLSFHHIIVRYQFVLARKGYLPEGLGQVHPKHYSPANSSYLQDICALLLVILFALFQLNPLTQVFGFMASIATVGCTLLMLLTSLAVFRYFRQNPEHIQNKFLSRQLIPALACVLLAGCLYLIISHFQILTGGSIWICVILACVPVIALLLGILRPVKLQVKPIV